METNKCKEKRNLQKYSRRLFCNKHIPPAPAKKKPQVVFCWKYSVQPSSLSGTYQFKICYKEGKHVDVFALDKLSLCEGEKGLPHVYNTDKQHLCIYHRPSEEWNASHKITEIIPWISEWFYYYENWLVTAKWLGGGIHRGKKE